MRIANIRSKNRDRVHNKALHGGLAPASLPLAGERHVMCIEEIGTAYLVHKQ